MDILNLINKFKEETGLSHIREVEPLKIWLEHKVGKRMDKPLFVSMGEGGGQTYKTLYEVYDKRHNNGKQSYFYNTNKKAIKELLKDGHIKLQDWVDDV